MGRKNRNARGRSYTSYAELKDTTVRFDLSKIQLPTKRVNERKVDENTDVRVSIGKANKKSLLESVAFSFSEKIATSLIKGFGRQWMCGIVKEGNSERLYFIPDEFGYSLYTNEHGKRYYVKIPTDTREIFEKYIGNHELKHDAYNNAYYITA